ncbi:MULTISPECIES: hypothetical protein [unclassified Novosphingobium]|uniref:hypothetical protein n=1 Tax=unclassified Novosphingobium TaxID=2644732 RepID=UPI00146C70B9|nr:MULTISPECIES: hypothetical protein [unclassified Novosphingobium]NMN03312.1 hypothetical protein [Novosphingobium sp. SG919]NMN86698.1 hypothetical protein [Novosphingobium sp. SG916]
MRVNPLFAAALIAVALPVAAHADDPADPSMRSSTARARDHEAIRRMNQAQLDYVRARDARYARQYRESTAAPDAYGYGYGAGYARGDDGYAQAQAQYQRDLAAWRQAVADCRAGYYEACGR